MEVIDSEGVTTHEYTNGNLVKRTNPNETVATYSYDSLGNLTNHSYNGYAFEYNTLGSILNAKTGEQTIVSYTYSLNPQAGSA